MILITGATGYIGSHTWLELIDAGHEVIGLDNFCNSSRIVLDRLKKLTKTPINFVDQDIKDTELLRALFKTHKIDAVIHFAALKAVGESVLEPLKYYENNINGLLSLTQVMLEHGCHALVFSSSATVYGNPKEVPILESASLHATNPYGQTKLIGEQILRDLEVAQPKFKVAYLRYFNPVGAHISGLIGEDPIGIPNNLMPYIAQVAIGQRPYLSVYGGDWPSHDGTGVRDYIHVVDLAHGHLKAINFLKSHGRSITVNLGTGVGYSVLDVVKAFEKASAKKIPYKIVDRRAGDIASCYADSGLAFQLMGWQSQYDLNRMCEDSWRWQSQNPHGFATGE
jgi:UDP-glucose 4-epimerase